jgi:hypothetical protein
MRYRAALLAMLLLVTAGVANAAAPARPLHSGLAGSRARARSATNHRRAKAVGATLFGLPVLKAAVAGLPVRHKRPARFAPRGFKTLNQAVDTVAAASAALPGAAAAATPARASSLAFVSDEQAAVVSHAASQYGPLLLGNTTVESNVDSVQAGQEEAFPFTAGASGDAASINVYVDSASQATSMLAGVYADRNGRPGVLIASGAVSSVTAGTWNPVPVSPVSASGVAAINAGTQYWISVLGQGGTLDFRDAASTGCNSQTTWNTGLTWIEYYWRGGAEGACTITATVHGTSTAAVAPVNSVLPAIGGTAQEGQTLTASTGTWSGSPTYAYQWEECDSSGENCLPISGATASTYTLPTGYAGRTVVVEVTATNNAGSTSATSDQSAVIAAAASTAPVNTSVPTVSGAAVVGQTLTATPGSWTGTAPITYAYAWSDGTTGPSDTLAAGDAGQTVAVTVTATNPAGSTQATSASVGPVMSASGSVPCALTDAAGADGTSSCWATNTGVQGATGYTVAQIEAGAPGFTHITDNVTVTTSGTIIDHEWISGCVAINATDVTIEDSLITPPDGDVCAGGNNGTAPSTVNNGDGSSTAGLLIKDTTVDGDNSTGNQFGVSIDEGECLRCNVFGFAKNYSAASNTAAHPAVFEDDYSHDLSINSCYPYPGGCTTAAGGASSDCAHDNGFYMNSSTYVDLEHDYSILTGAGYCTTGAITNLADYGTPNNMTVTDSYMEGDAGADLYTGKAGACGTPNIVVTNNAFSDDNGYNGTDFVNFWTTVGNTWSGNYIAESGATLGSFPEPVTSSGC